MSVRVRFAPSPTGFLHIGGVRTALYCWLYARRHGGQFLLRIEDTDLERSEEKYTQDILASMKWLGLNWDEEPIFQSKHLGVYMQKALELVEKGHAYRCYCTADEVEKMREVATAAGQKPMYDRRCREKKLPYREGVPHVIRLKIPLTGSITFDDLIRGPIEFPNSDIDDYVLIRSNGAPTYNLSCVVDDVGSRMTHVIRGDDHINNTPKQAYLYRYFDYPVPKFAHLPMILGADKKKLSKRHGAVSANAYRSEGFLPETMLNFLAKIGWSHGDQELFTLEEMVQFFSFDHVQKSSGVFNAEKLLWMNGEYIRKADPIRLAGIVVDDFASHFMQPARVTLVTTPLGIKLVSLIQAKVKLIKELAEQLVPLCQTDPVTVDPAPLKWNKDPTLKSRTQAAVAEAITQWDARMKNVTARPGEWGDQACLSDSGLTHEGVDAELRAIGEKNGVKLGDLTQPMRLTVTGRMVSAGLFDLLAILPWKMVRSRLEQVGRL